MGTICLHTLYFITIFLDGSSDQNLKSARKIFCMTLMLKKPLKWRWKTLKIAKNCKIFEISCKNNQTFVKSPQKIPILSYDFFVHTFLNRALFSQWLFIVEYLCSKSKQSCWCIETILCLLPDFPYRYKAPLNMSIYVWIPSWD